MKLTIVHDAKGKILGVIQPVDLQRAGSKFQHVNLNPGPDQQLTEVELDAELERLPVLDLHEQYEIDMAASKLMKKPAS
ncbi:hypothetical protein [Paraburkholderia sp. BCC1884]|uniref:hypothetical protein n=1 Tax=Paraburkholderia sp. BCC1884 TaxID=2562668 RepID=UPI00118282EB|nr:hypothetical protein [Paraburkholderia sp. BCC1884]